MHKNKITICARFFNAHYLKFISLKISVADITLLFHVCGYVSIVLISAVAIILFEIKCTIRNEISLTSRQLMYLLRTYVHTCIGAQTIGTPLIVFHLGYIMLSRLIQILNNLHIIIGHALRVYRHCGISLNIRTNPGA